MKTSTLFVLGLVAGALVVFTVRAVIAVGAQEAPDAARPAAPPAPHAAGHGAPETSPSDGLAPSHDMGAPHEGGHAMRPEPDDPAPPPMPDDHSHDVDAPQPEASSRAATGDQRPPENTICPVMGNPVDPECFVDYEGRRIGFCCPGCDQLFLQEPEKYLKKVDAELAERSK